MHVKKPGWLTFISIAAVIVLLAMTDFSPTSIDDFSSLPREEGRVRIICFMTTSTPAKDGVILLLEDPTGSQLRAYCNNQTLTAVPRPNSLVEITGTFRPGAQPIIFVESIRALS